MVDRERPSVNRVVVVLLGMVAILALAGLNGALAQGIVTRYQYDDGNGRFTMVPKGGTTITPSSHAGKAAAVTLFDFHPAETQTTPLTKNLQTNTVSPSRLTHVYTEKEQHGTAGSASHSMSFRDVNLGNNQTVKVLDDNVMATIAPGRNERPEAVNIQAKLLDPIVFSNTSSQAQYPLTPQGLDVPFSLLKGTAFPALFTSTLDQFGALTDGTSLTFRARIVPYAEPDPLPFWSDGLPGAVDLFTLTLTSDINHHVTATLVAGASDSDFTLNFSGFSTAPGTIASAFDSTGLLNTDLNNVFSAGFVPSSSLSAYTLGFDTEADLAMSEKPGPVPEPSAFALAVVGGLGLAAAVWRRRVE
jgi:hypothetical protein